MADAKTTDEDELIPVEAPIEDEQQAAEAEQADDDDEDDGDDRLAQSEDDHEDDIAANTNRERRKQRRDKQRRAREAKEREVAELRQIVLEQQQRLAAVEGHTTQSVVQSLEQKIAQTQSDIRQAEMIIAKATEAGNGEDVVAAMRIRDAANADLMRLAATREQYAQPRQPQVPQVDPMVTNYAQQWMAANTWYNPAGTDRDSALTKAIDAEIMAEGYDPKSREYWEELTARVADALGESEPARPKRKAPPTGKGREHAPVSTRKEIYVTPERKQAMIEAGAWEDPVKRQRMLKAYQAYDNGSAR